MTQYADFNENIKAVICQNIKKYRNEKGVDGWNINFYPKKYNQQYFKEQY